MITVFMGENTAERDKAINTYISKFSSDYGQMAVDNFNSDESRLSDLIDSVSTIPFLSTKRMVVARYLSNNKELATNIEKIFSRVPESTELVIVETTIDSRTVYAKTIKSKSDDLKLFENLEGSSLISWVEQAVHDLGGSINRATASYLIDRVGQNQQLLKSECQKLVLFNKNITNKTVDEMTLANPSSSVFNMIDALMAGDIAKASILYDEQRQQGNEPKSIMGMFAWQLFILATIIADPLSSPDVVAKRSKLNSFVVRKNSGLAKKIGKAKLIDICDMAINTDIKIKTGHAKDDEAVHLLLLDIANKLK